LQPATSILGRCDAAATVVVHSFDASLSPPALRDGMLEFATLNPEFDPNEVTLICFFQSTTLEERDHPPDRQSYN
jgi:hypothetical protein